MVGNVASDDLMVFTGNANPALARTIVRHLDIPLGTVKSRSYRAHRKLTELLSDVEEVAL